jgi:hypothetical protein
MPGVHSKDVGASAKELEDLTDGWVDRWNALLMQIMIVAKEKGQSAQMRKEFDEILAGLNDAYLKKIKALYDLEARAETAELVGRVQMTNAQNTINKLTAENAQLQADLDKKIMGQ